MITPVEEYYSHLIQIKDINKPQLALLLPKEEEIYSIDLDTRTIKAPKFLSVKTDHYAETIYFKVDRYYDNMDLADTICLIQFVNDGVKKETGEADNGHFYLVPFYDITTLQEEKKILFPWMISGAATAAAGNITFSIRFFQLNAANEYIYSLNTQPATSKILHGMTVVDKEADNLVIPATTLDYILSELDRVSRQSTLYWIDV